MNWEEIKECVNEWIWDNELRTYFWLLETEEIPKTLRVKRLYEMESKIFFCPERFFKEAKSIRDF